MFFIQLLVVPFLLGTITLFLKNEKAARVLAFFTAALTLASTVQVVMMPEYAGSEAYTLDLTWLPELGISLAFKVDALSAITLILAALAFPFIVGTAAHHSYGKDSGKMYGLMQIMLGAMIGVFTASDGFLFYIFWELALLPIYFICLSFGGKETQEQDGRGNVFFKFFVYTLAGSLFMLLGLIGLYLATPAPHSFSFDALALAAQSLPVQSQYWVFWAMFVAFAVKMPIWPFHTWQPATYANAPAPGTMLLSGIMLKMGIFGMVRWLWSLVPDVAADYDYLIILFATIGIVYASVIALRQDDFKRLLAYSSIAHVGMIGAGLFTSNEQGVEGALFQMLPHGLNVVGLFFIADILERRTGTRKLSELGGLRNQAPALATYFFIILLSQIALPLTSGFVGDFSMLSGLYQFGLRWAIAAGLSVILGAVYMLTAYQKAMLGEKREHLAGFKDLTLSEHLVLAPLAGMVFVFGLCPWYILDLAKEAYVIYFAGTASAF